MLREESLRRRSADKPKSLLVSVKTNIVAIAAIIAAAGTIALAPIHFDARYAHADDVKQLTFTTNNQTQILKQAIVQQQINWLEYYSDRIRMLEIQKFRAKPSEIAQINRDIDDVKNRKTVLERSLIEPVDINRFNR